MEIRNPTFNARGTIDCEIQHPVYGWIPFTADPDDPEEHGREIYARAADMDPAPYVQPAPPEPTALPLSRQQFEWLLAYTGLDDVWRDVEAAAKQSDREMYADIRSARQRPSFRFENTMQFIARVAAMVPEGADVSEETIAAAWGRALQAS